MNMSMLLSPAFQASSIQVVHASDTKTTQGYSHCLQSVVHYTQVILIQKISVML
jgi:hypothetical protein